jgi:hypothetical protein
MSLFDFGAQEGFLGTISEEAKAIITHLFVTECRSEQLFDFPEEAPTRMHMRHSRYEALRGCRGCRKPSVGTARPSQRLCGGAAPAGTGVLPASQRFDWLVVVASPHGSAARTTCSLQIPMAWMAHHTKRHSTSHLSGRPDAPVCHCACPVAHLCCSGCLCLAVAPWPTGLQSRCRSLACLPPTPTVTFGPWT